MTQLFTFFMSLFATVLFFCYAKVHNYSDDEPEKKTYTQALPWVGIMWLIHTFTTFICVLIHAIDKAFADDMGGYITMLVFCIIFLCCWTHITLSFTALANEKYGNHAGES